MKIYTVRAIWDGGVWYASTDEEVGVTLESMSFDTLVNRVHMAMPEMLELNCGYKGQYRLVFRRRMRYHSAGGMMANFSRAVKGLLHDAGCTFVRKGAGDYEIWYSPITEKHFTVDNSITVDRRKRGNRIAGLLRKESL
jgi:hypothetical protein